MPLHPITLVGAGPGDPELLTLKAVRALKAVSLRIAAGERVALVGPNGSGKSTLLRTLHGLLLPATGTASRDPAQRQAMLFQRPHLLRTSALNNLTLGLWLDRSLGLTWQEARERAGQAMARVGLQGIAAQVVDALGLQKFALGGNSMGGAIAAKYAMVHPQHLDALILVDAGGAPQPANRKGRGNIGFTLAAMPGINWLAQSITPRSLIARSLSQTVSNQAVVTPAAVDRYWELLRYPGNRAATMQRFAAKREPFTPAELARITAPTLILWGDEDPLIPVADTQFFAQGIKNARVKTWPGVGHLPHEEVADASAAEVRAFLSPQR